MRILTSIMLVLFLAVACRATSILPKHTDFAIGMNQDNIRSQFGKPIQIITFHKTDDAIWGPIETYWATIALGSTVVVWSYESESQMGEGRTELYFLNGNIEVSGIGFSPKGVVYESSGT